MRPTDIVKLEVKVGSTWVDYSEGIIDIGIIRGVQGYQYIWQQPEAGILTLISRNPNLDPYNDENIRSGREIRIKTDTSNIFSGRISEINVDYQPKGKPPQITLVAVDMIGTMALHTLKDGFTERLGSVMDIYGMFQELVSTSGSNPAVPSSEYEIIGFTNPFRENPSGLTPTANSSGVTSSGSSALSVATTLSEAKIQFFYADTNNDVYLYNRMNKKKDDAIKLQFDSRGGATSYREIELTDNFDVLTNQLSIKNQGYNSNIIPLYTNSYSVSEWGPSRKEFTIQSNGFPASQNSETDVIRDIVFQDSAHPSKEIYYVVWDGMLNVAAASDIDILDNVYIYHEVDPEDISRKYGIIGIEHRITADDWNIKYYVKNHFIYDTNFPNPIIETNHPLGGTINDDITFSITNAADIDLTSATYSWRYESGTLPIELVGTVFSTAASPVVNYTTTQTGVKNIRCTVTDSYGFVKQSNILLQQVAGAAPTAVTISYTINPSDTAIYTFTATTTDATSYTFHWGDGTTYTTTQTSATHRYSTTGNKSVYVVANNGFGSTQSATTVINVAFTPFPAAEVGTWPLRYIALASPYQNISGTGTLIPVYGRLQLNTSNAPSGSPSTDPQVNRALTGSYETVANKEPYSTQPTGLSSINNPTKINIQSGQSALSDWTYWNQTISGAFNNSIIFDMGAPYYDIDNIKITFKNLSTTQYVSHTFNVWVTDNINNTFDFNSSNWYKIGTISSGTLAPNGLSSPSIVLDSAIPSLPLNLQPFPAFTYTIGNTSPTITQDKYTFSTSDFYTSSYLWNFGDGTTSTLQNPVKTWTTSGSKTVTLTKYDEFGNAYTSSQTFTVTILADQQGTKPVRYIRIRQNSFSSTINGPMLGGLQLLTSQFLIDRAFRRHINGSKTDYAGTTLTTFWKENGASADVQLTDLTNQITPLLGQAAGYNMYPSVTLTSPITGLTNYYDSGIEPRNAAGTTQWDITIDLGTPRYDIKTIKLFFNRNNLGTSTGTRPTYRIEFSSDNTNWTHVANITTPTMSGATTWYQGNTSYTASLPLNL